jgi:fluoroquinolone transport system permease protein
MLLERDEGTLTALAVSPFSPGAYLATRTVTLTTLAALESLAVVWIAFGMRGSWLLILSGTAALGVLYTCLGAAVACRYGSVNTLLLPASVFVGLLLLPLLAHFGLAPRALFLLHPIEPALTLMRAGYGVEGPGETFFGLVGSLAWGTVAYRWARSRVERLMRDTRAGGGR